MLKNEKLQEIINQCDIVAKLERETAWAYAFDKPECVRKQLVSDSVDARGQLIELLLKLEVKDFE